MFRRFAFPAVAAATLAAAAPAAPAAPRTVVTVYTHDLGFVHEWRTLALAGGRDTVRIADVPERIDVPSVRLTPGSGRVDRLAYRYDVANGDALLDRARGGRVRITLRGDRIALWTILPVEKGDVLDCMASLSDSRLVRARLVVASVDAQQGTWLVCAECSLDDAGSPAAQSLVAALTQTRDTRDLRTPRAA